MKIITEKLQNLWNSDEVRILVLLSLGIQIALIILAPLRKRITNIMLALALWLLYLTADNVATLGLGNISHQTPGGIGVSSELTVLWAPFLLVHLGGPDTITSYSIEDNELWWRHLLGLVFQVIITVYIFIQSPPTGWLWIPTIFVFIPGLIKFAERTHALRVASKDNIKDKIISELRLGSGNRTTEVSTDNTSSNAGQANGTTIGNTDSTTPNPDQANRTTEVSKDNTPSNTGPATKGFWGLMGCIQAVLFPPEDTIDILVSSFTDISKDEGDAILEGFRWFNIFKRLLVDVTFDADLLMKSQDRFSDLSPTVALNLVAIELSFLYDYLHTKAVHMHCILGRALRYFSLVSIIAAFVVFHHLDMQKYVPGDIIITYILFGVGLSLEVIATILLVFSDWTVVALKRTKRSECVVGCITALVKLISKERKRRWAHTIGHFNLVNFSLRDRDTIGDCCLVHVLAKIMRIVKLKNKWDNMRESKLIPLPNKLVEIMVTEAKRRAQNVHIYKVLVEARAYRGNKTLERHNQLEKLEWSMKREFDESIILWHLATDICYYLDEPSNQPNVRNEEFSNHPSGENQEPSDKPNGENQPPSNKPCLSCLCSKQPNGENQEHSDQPNGENEEPSHQPNGTCGLKSCLSRTSKQPNGKEDTEREVSLKTSNYMMYLLTQQQSMMQLGYGKTRFEATCSVVKNKFKGKGMLKGSEARKELMNNASVTADGSQSANKMGTSVLKKIWANLRQWGLKKIWKNLGRCTPLALKNWCKCKRDEDEGAPQVSEQTNASESAEGSQPTNKMGTSVFKKIWAYLRCWGRRKRKDEGAPQVSEQTNASESAEGSQPTNKMGTSVFKKIWAYLRCWGRRNRKDEEATQVSEENNASESAEGSQPTNKMGTSVFKKIWAYLRCWGRRNHKEEEATQVSEENNASVPDGSQPNPSVPDGSQPTNKMGTSVLKKIWENLGRCTPPALKNWCKRKREEDKRKRKGEDEMGEKVLHDGLRLAKELLELKKEIRWKLISETWMEMLGYAAIHCDSYQHAKSLSRGGELLTHLWLLMSQLGVVEEHKMQQYQSGTV